MSVDGHRYVVDAMVFDKDGTLVDFDALWCGWAAAICERVAEAAGGGIDRLATDIGVDLRLGRHVPDGPLAVGAVSEVAVILAHALYRAGLPWGGARARVDAAVRDAEALLGDRADVRPVHGAPEFVHRAAAAGVAGAVVTADETDRARSHLARLGLAGPLPVVVGVDRVSDGGKPAPEGILTACAELGAAPARTVLVGDSEGDMRAATAAGLAAGIRIGGHGRESDGGGATHLIASFDELDFPDEEARP
jgi:phosphoglycolate phosphatase